MGLKEELANLQSQESEFMTRLMRSIEDLRNIKAKMTTDNNMLADKIMNLVHQVQVANAEEPDMKDGKDICRRYYIIP
ncbi:hypothetical protein LWI28_023235 [Acer negundo]|uniref:Uncharacterized protein n=1 Tax=Acer negundo TaxID=4023 RepID=A0AAD5IK27_ACENE|nr:hypothetical protein LWI28_023235 [Acer negundo]KAK4838618.1 hypothetical protein QYF36_015107 [Acer negundo]